MKLKQAILTIMDRDTLKALVDDLEIEGVDRRSVEEMRAKLSRSRRAAPEMLLAHLSEKRRSQRFLPGVTCASETDADSPRV
ncbi:MAG: hypothetical protein WAK95_19750 [Desulfobacterales bacterium]